MAEVAGKENSITHAASVTDALIEGLQVFPQNRVVVLRFLIEGLSSKKENGISRMYTDM